MAAINLGERVGGLKLVKIIKISYYPETDSLYIDLSSKSSIKSREISEGVVVDYDADGSITGTDLDNASRKIDLEELTLKNL